MDYISACQAIGAMETHLCLALPEDMVQWRTWARLSAVAHANQDIIAPRSQPTRDRNLAQGNIWFNEVLDLRRVAGSAWVGTIAQPHRQSVIRTNVVMLSFIVLLDRRRRFRYGRGTILKVET